MTIFEVLQNAHYNLNENGEIGRLMGMDQFNNAMEQLEDGKSLYDEFEDKGELSGMKRTYVHLSEDYDISVYYPHVPH